MKHTGTFDHVVLIDGIKAHHEAEFEMTFEGEIPPMLDASFVADMAINSGRIPSEIKDLRFKDLNESWIQVV